MFKNSFFFNKENKETTENKTQVVAILNQKGGVGKTTMTFNLAYALREMKQKVLCLDFDPQANLSLLFQHSSSHQPYNIYHLLVNSLRELKALHQPVMVNDVISHHHGVDLLPAGQELSGLDLISASLQSSPRQLILQRFLEKSGLLQKEKYDFILIDSPPTLGLIVINILCVANQLLIPFAADQFSQHGLKNLQQTILDVEEMGISPTPERIGFIPNLVDGRRKQQELDYQMIKENLNLESDSKSSSSFQTRQFAPFIDRVQLVNSNGHKKSVFDYQNKDYKELQQQFLDIAKWLTLGINIEEKKVSFD